MHNRPKGAGGIFDKFYTFIKQNNMSMKRFTLNGLVLLTISTIALAQRPAEQNAFLIGTQNGTVNEAKAYDKGFVFLGSDGSNDMVGFSANGQAISIAETLELGTATRLSAWAGDNKAFYFGTNTADVDTIDLRRLTSGTPSLHLDMSGGHDRNYPAVGKVFRKQYATEGTKYYYPVRGIFKPIGGYQFNMYESDGSDFGTFETNIQQNDDPFNPGPISMNFNIRLSSEGFFEAVDWNDQFFFFTASDAAGYPYSQLTYVDYSGSGSTLRPLYIDDNLSSELSNLIATDNYLYASFYFDNTNDDRGGVKAIDSNGDAFNVVYNQSQLTVTNEKPVAYGERAFVIAENQGSNVEKLAIIKSPSEVELIHINGIDEDDAISDLTISGNRLFFFASKSGSSARTLYALRADIDNPTPVEVLTAYDGYEPTAIEPVEGGVAYAVWNATEKISFVYITEGFGATTYQAVDENLDFGWAKITQIVANGNELFIFEENTDAQTSAVTTEVYHLTHVPASATKPNPVPYSSFYRGNFIMTVQDSETGANIEGASVTINNHLDDPFIVTSNTNGQALYAWKPVTFYQYKISATGYQPVEYDEWATIWIPDETYNSYGERTVQLVPDGATGIGDNEIKNLRLFPIPVSAALNIQSESSITSLTIYGLTGTKVKEIVNTQISTVDVSALSPGIYIVVLKNADGHQTTTKFTKK